MLEPQEVELSCLITADYVETYYFWEDEDLTADPPIYSQTTPYDFTGWTQFTFQLGDTTYTQTLDVNGDGLVVDLSHGAVTMNISRIVTSGMTPGSMSFALSAIDGDSKLGFLILGPFIWKSPL